MPKKINYVPGSTKKLYQLTGEYDRQLNQPTQNRTESRFGLFGTDLGASFEHNGRIYFLFGDTVATNDTLSHRFSSGDSIAYTENDDPEQGLHLHFITPLDDPNNYLSPTIEPPIRLGAFEVPTSGFSARNKVYVFFTTGASKDMNGNEIIGQSFLASAQNNDLSPCRFHYLYDVSDLNQGGKFISVSTAIVNNAHIYSLPETSGQGLLIWGSGLYRKSNPYLAYILLDGIEDKDNLRFFAGLEAGTHRPVWSIKEYDAIQLFDHPRIGEFSVSWNAFLNVWIMLYNSDDPRGINFRVAEKPWGPWSPTAVLFEPRVDQGYCHFIHQSWDDGVCDNVHDPGRQAVYGGEYGPCIISRYTKGDSKLSTIYFVMSTWNPYNTFLMRSRLERKPGFDHTHHIGNPVMIQSRFNQKRSFEVLVPAVRNSLLHYWRNNNNKNMPWSFATSILSTADQIDAVTLIHSKFGDSGNLDAIARIKDRLFCFWREAPPQSIWRGFYPMTLEDKNVHTIHNDKQLPMSQASHL